MHDGATDPNYRGCRGAGWAPPPRRHRFCELHYDCCLNCGHVHDECSAEVGCQAEGVNAAWTNLWALTPAEQERASLDGLDLIDAQNRKITEVFGDAASLTSGEARVRRQAVEEHALELARQRRASS